jgi:hypothetical protein
VTSVFVWTAARTSAADTGEIGSPPPRQSSSNHFASPSCSQIGARFRDFCVRTWCVYSCAAVSSQS